MVTYLKEVRSDRYEASMKRVSQTVSEMLDDIQQNGETAVRKYSNQLDGWNPDSFRITAEQIDRAKSKLSQTVIEDIAWCQAQVREFAKRQLDTMRGLEVETLPGVILGHKHIPVGSVGSYVPGGRYSMVASAYMSIITPKAAGVERVVACTPPTKDGEIYAPTLHSIHSSGADEIYCIGGVQALASMAFGTSEVLPVDMIVGPGNAFVAEAKRQLFGQVGIDLLAGPTEILIIADESADPNVLAADLVGQAEHDPHSRAILIATSEAVAKATMDEVDRQLKTLPTREVAEPAWRENGVVAVVKSDEEAARLSDEFAPEHLEVHVRNHDWFADRLRNYGALFIGEEATVAYADKVIGTNHILPTRTAARYTGGLWVGKFLKTVTYQKLTGEGSRAVAGVASRQCTLEGMLAHAITADIRLDRYGERESTASGRGATSS